jgi:ParB family chromosome partitioning protein
MKNKLGRGLAALLGEPLSAGKTQSQNIKIEDIVPNEAQPRKYFAEDAMKELADSIALHGILQPIVVREANGKFEIVAGERRWRAAKMANLTEVPVHIVNCSESDVMILAMVENLQRTDLNPIEEAEALKQLMESCDCKQEDLSEMLSKSRSHISNTMRLLTLPERVREMIRFGQLSAGHGRCLVGAPDAVAIAETAVREGWNVRQLEREMQNRKLNQASDEMKHDKSSSNNSDIETLMNMRQDPESADIAERITSALKIETRLKITKKGGVFTLVCKSCEELESLIEKLLSLQHKH